MQPTLATTEEGEQGKATQVRLTMVLRALKAALPLHHLRRKASTPIRKDPETLLSCRKQRVNGWVSCSLLRLRAIFLHLIAKKQLAAMCLE